MHTAPAHESMETLGAQQKRKYLVPFAVKAHGRGSSMWIPQAGQRSGAHHATLDTWTSFQVVPSRIPCKREFAELKLPCCLKSTVFCQSGVAAQAK